MRSIQLASVLLTALFAVVLWPSLALAKSCTLPSECSPCTEPSIADFAFFVDGTGSMRAEINAVRNGLTSFAAEIAARNIDARFAVIIVGGMPELFMDWVTVTNTLQANYVAEEFKKISTNHGGQEPTLEAMGMALRKRVSNSFERGSSRRSLTWRSNAKKFFIVLTDEDSDRPYTCSNAYSCMKNFGSCSSSYEASSFSYTNCWGTEVSNTANWLISEEVDAFMFVNDKSGKSQYQFGVTSCNSANQNADFTDFNPAGVRTCLAAQSVSKARSLQGRVLAANRDTSTVRLFDVTQIESPNFVKNFFAEAAAAASSCERRRRRKRSVDVPAQSPRLDVPPAADADMLVDGRRVTTTADGSAVVVHENVWDHASKRNILASCEIHTCENLKCKVEYTCADGCTGVCKIGNQCYEHRASNPANSCQYCDAYGGSPNQWKECGSNNGQIGYECAFQKCDASTGNQCVDFVPCLPKCNCCCIGGDFDKLNGADRECTAPTDHQVDIGTRAPPEDNVDCGICDPIDGDIVLSKDPAGTIPANPWDSGTKYLQWSLDQDCVARGQNCSDGIRNQGETDVDCGGPCPACVDVVALCANGQQDAATGETGVDCGGVCEPCATCLNGVQDAGEDGIDCGDVCGAPCASTGACSSLVNDAGQPCGQDCTIPCETTPCGDLTCLNSAWCRSGKCDCTFTDFHGPECSTPDAMDCPVTCKNGAHCVPGNQPGDASSCDCAGTGCSGADCDQNCTGNPGNDTVITPERRQCLNQCEPLCASNMGLWRCDCDPVAESVMTLAICNNGLQFLPNGATVPVADAVEQSVSALRAAAQASASAYLLQNGGAPGENTGLSPAIIGAIIGSAIIYCILYVVFSVFIWRSLPDDDSSSSRSRREMGSRARRSRRGSHRSHSHRSMRKGGDAAGATLDYD